GERFLNGAYRAHTTINRSGRPLWIDRQRLAGGEAALASEQGLAGKSVVGTLVWIGLPLADTVVAEARTAWSAMAGQGEAGVTVVAAGLACRYRGESTAEARQWFSTVWDLLSATGAPQRAGHHSLAVTGWRC
ncbi:MAG: urease accessory protein UreD, partial [Candidatus Sericytochromatia bacterium]|nr:urease accessory protein UreD [Candidatus Sericytochromatia bacterium]